MVLPITTPAARNVGFNVNGPFPGSWRRKQTVVRRQKRPYNLNLPYRQHFSVTLDGKWSRWPSSFGQIMNWGVGYAPPHRRAQYYYGTESICQELQTRLAGKLNAEIRGSTAGLGISLVEGHQAFNMITSRLFQLRHFTRSVKRLDFRAAWWILKHGTTTTPRPKDLARIVLPPGLRARKGAKHFANNFLEFHFGWSPLIKDIQDAFEVLDAPIPLGKYGVSSGFPNLPEEIQRESVGSSSWGEHWWTSTKHKLKVVGRCGVDVEVTNPNALLASNLGLTQPWSLVWEVIPFSFVVDWFVNVGSYLEQFEVFHPFIYRDPWWSWLVQDHAMFEGEIWYNAVKYERTECTTIMRSSGRETVMPKVSLHRKRVPLFEGKLKRALAASSLLIQAMKY